MILLSILISSGLVGTSENYSQNASISVWARASGEHSIAVLVNYTIYDKLQESFKYLQEVMNNTGYSYSFSYFKIRNENAQSIRNILKNEYEAHNIVGAILVGNIPLYRYEDEAIGEVIEFPYYYMDLNGVWKDSDGDGIIDTPGGDYYPEIWVGIVRSTGDGNNVTQIESYIGRVIGYLNGKLNPEVKSGAFIDDDFLYMDDKVKEYLAYPYLGEDILDENTNTKDFLKFLSQNYAYAYLIVHSDGSSYFVRTSEGFERIFPNNLKSVNGLFYTDFSCYGASFEKGAVANYLLMGRNSSALGVLTYTGLGDPDAMPYYHLDLGEGMSFGDALFGYMLGVNKYYFNAHIAMLAYLGFPFLKPWRPYGYKEIRDLEIGGNIELLKYAQKYGWAGEGTKKDPIRISNLMIFSTQGYGSLQLINVSLYVEISHCWILTRFSEGIGVWSSQNVVIENNTVYYSSIYVARSENVSLEGNFVEGVPYYGAHRIIGSIEILNSSYIKVSGNKIRNGGGINVHGKMIGSLNNGVLTFKIYYSKNINVSNNQVEGWFGITFAGVKDSCAYRNKLEFIYGGLKFYYSKDNFIIENDVVLIFTSNTWTFGNTHDYYLDIFSSHNNYFYLNNFIYKGTPPKDVDFSAFVQIGKFSAPSTESIINYWNTSKYGNYWQWWAQKNDTNDEDGDGIVDYPYVLGVNNTDYKPLKEPYAWKMNNNVQNNPGGMEYDMLYTTLAVFGIVLVVVLASLHRKLQKH